MNTKVVILISLALAAVMPGQVLASSNEEAAETFAQLDTNADGRLTPEEAEGHPDPDMVDSFADGDDNDDGVLDLVEFTKLEVTDE